MDKQKKLQKLTKYFSRVGDKTGLGIDKGILETVVILNVLEINTSASCEGHIDHGVNGPWVDFESNNIGKFNEEIKKVLEIISKKERDKKPKKEINVLFKKLHKLDYKRRLENLKNTKRLVTYLGEFYKNRNTVFDERLIIIFYASFIRVVSQGADMQDLNNKSTRRKKLLEYQEEMRSFTKFLTIKYLNG